MKEIEIQHPDWLAVALERVESSCRMAREGKFPDAILGWMLVVPCLHLLRSIYGSDELAL